MSLAPVKQIDAGVLNVGYAEVGPADARHEKSLDVVLDQACKLRDAWAKFGNRASLFGISTDSLESHRSFIVRVVGSA